MLIVHYFRPVSQSARVEWAMKVMFGCVLHARVEEKNEIILHNSLREEESCMFKERIGIKKSIDRLID